MTETTALAMQLVNSQQEQHEVTVNEDLNVLDAAVGNQININLTADADYNILITGAPAQWQYNTIVMTDTGVVLTAPRNVIWPSAGYNRRSPFFFGNGTAQALTLKRSGQTGVTILPGATSRMVRDNSTDIVQLFPPRRTPITVTASTTLTKGYDNIDLLVNSASNLTITLPQTSTETVPLNFDCNVIRQGTGTVTFAIQGSDTLLSESSLVTISARYAEARVRKIVTGSPNTWLLTGKLA